MTNSTQLLTARGKVLLCLAGDCNSRMRDIAAAAGITERTAYDVVCGLVRDGYVSRDRDGRRNCYRIHPERAKDAQGEREGLLRLAAALDESPAASTTAAA